MRVWLRNILTAVAAVILSLTAIGSASGDGVHIVKAGDTLWGIASSYRLTVEALAELNGIANPGLIFPGQLIKLPRLNGGTDAGVRPQTYEVRPGDTLSGIADRFGLSTEELRAVNVLVDPNLIFPEQRLSIPGGGDSAAAAPVMSVEGRPNDPEREAMMNELAIAQGVDPGLVKAVAWMESGWQQGLVSPTGAVGVMQIMPATAAWLEADVFGQPLNEDVSAYDNVKMGVKLLRLLLNSTGSVEMALAAYYQGAGVTTAGVLYRETVQYVQAVMAIKARFWP